MKDHDAYDRQIEQQSREMHKLREEVAKELKRREELIE